MRSCLLNWKSASLCLLVACPVFAAANDFIIAVAPSAQTLPAGLTAVYTVSTAVSSGAAQSISLTASGLPAGVTAAFSPSTVSAGNSSTLKLTATACAAGTTKQFTVTGTGKTKHSTSAKVQVVAGPTVSVASPVPNAVVAGIVAISVKGIGCKPITGIDVAVDGALLSSVTATSVTVAWDTTGWPDGAHTITARAHDSTGKVGPYTLVPVTIRNPPSVTLVYPAEGEADDVVQVFGSRFSSVFSVTIGGVPATFTIVDDGSLNVTVPAGAPIGSTQLVLSNVAGSTPAAFLVHDQTPWVTFVSPPAAGPGANVTISGRHFIDVEGVWLGGARAYFTGSGTGPNETGYVSAWVPDDVATGPIRVTSATRGTGASGTFTVLPPLAMSPSHGPPGTEVVLEGPQIGSATSVSFMEDSASFQVVDATHLRTWVPAHATSSHIVVSIPGGAPSTPVFVVPRNGEQRTLVMRLQPLDRTQDCTNEQVQSIFFGPAHSADALFGSASGARMRVTGDVVGPLLLPYTDAGCNDLGAWFQAADDLARQAGYDPSSYGHKAYVMPSNACGTIASAARGLLSLPAAYCGPGTEGETSHEFGHSLGLQHASSPAYEYGDPTDVMGGGDYVGPNAPHRIQLGWLADSAWTSLSSGSATLAPLDGSSSQLQVVWIPGRGNDFFASYVRRIDVASQNLPDAYADHVLVHTVSHEPTRGVYPHTILRAALTDGGSYTSPEEGVRIDVLSHGAAGAQIAISSSAPTCFRNFPTFSAGPTSQSATAGTPLTYTYSVTNNDVGECPVSTWRMLASANYGPWDARWIPQFNPETLTLHAGETATANLTITSPINAQPQDFYFTPGITDDLDQYDHPWLLPNTLVLHYLLVAP
jgi:Big-like domain-containing protein/gametolysin peptidase M11/IPT/TIG domain-containing protein